MFRVPTISTLVACLALTAPGLRAEDKTPATSDVKRLSLQEAIGLSLQNNLQVEIARESLAVSQGSLLQSQGAFDWNTTGSFTWNRQNSSSSSAFQPGAPVSITKSTLQSRSLNLGVQKPFEWGGNLQLSYAPKYSSNSGRVVNGLTDNTGAVIGDRYFSTANPYTGTLGATYTQSLLKGFGRAVTESPVLVARLGAQAASYQFRAKVIDIVATTETLYWDVVYTARNLENKKQALALAEKQLRENKIRVEVGTLAPIEITSAEAAVAQREQEIIAAEAQSLNAKDALIRALWPKTERPAGLETTEAPNPTHLTLDEKAAENMALERRVELKAARLDLEAKRVSETASENRLKPQLDAFVSYNGGSDNFTGIGPVNGDLGHMRNPGYSVGLNFAMPLGNRAAKGALSQARATRRSSELTVRDQELGIILEVRTAFRTVEAAEKAVKASEKTRIFRQKDLEAEQKKYENGMSTNFLVLSKQNDLDSTKSSELQAQIAYAKAVTSLEKALGNLLEARKLELR